MLTKTDIQELNRAIGDHARQLNSQPAVTLKQERDLFGAAVVDQAIRMKDLEDALQRIYWLGCSGEVEEIIIGILSPTERAEWARGQRDA